MKPATHFLIVMAAGLAGCATQPSTPAQAPTTALLLGATTTTTRVLIKSIDDGPTRWVAPGALGGKVTVTPGHHKVSVLCEVEGSWVEQDLTVDAQAGRIYDLVGSASEGPRKCEVSASSHA
jgi:uncharacterized lipoprotein YajG